MTDWQKIAEEFGLTTFWIQYKELEIELQESRAESARLRAALEKVHLPSCNYWSSVSRCTCPSGEALATSDGKEQLEAVKEAIATIRGGTEKCGVFWREDVEQKLRKAFGIEA